MSEKCRHCVDWSDVHWPQKRIHIDIWGIMAGGSVVLMVTLSFMLKATPEGSPSLSVLNWIGCIGGTFFGVFAILYSLFLLLRRGLFNYWRYDIVGETIYVSVDAEEQLHVHLHEELVPPPFTNQWKPSPCLVWKGKTTDPGRIVKREQNTMLLEINLGCSKKCEVYSHWQTQYWHASFDRRSLHFTDDHGGGMHIPFPQPEQTDANEAIQENALQHTLSALKISLIALARFNSMAQLKLSAVRPEADEPKEVAGSITPSAS